MHQSTRPADVPRYGDDAWEMSRIGTYPSSGRIWIAFDRVPPRYREAAREIAWSWLNHPTPVDELGRKTSIRRQITPSSVAAWFEGFRPFLRWLEDQHPVALDRVTERMLGQYEQHVRAGSGQHRYKTSLLFTVTRAWLHAPFLSPSHRLRRPPWEDGRGWASLGPSDWSGANSTRPVHPQVMSLLLVWALRFVDDFAPDIQAAIAERARLEARRRRHAGPGERSRARAYIEAVRASGGQLPGTTHRGKLELARDFLAATLDVGTEVISPDHLLRPLPIGPGAPLATTITRRIDGEDQPWRDAIDWAEVASMRRLLATACLIVTTYLTGMRPHEALALPRGCCAPVGAGHEEPARWLIAGREYKGVMDDEGNTVLDGRARTWHAIGPVARAIACAESLHEEEMVFAYGAFAASSAERRTPGPLTINASRSQLSAFIAWVNAFTDARGRPDERIPEDPDGAISLSRFRRTLAWFIYRQPGGRVALGVQYGHLRDWTSEGYGARTGQGLLDVFPLEEALARVDALTAAKQALDSGGGVSGPAARRYLDGMRAFYPGAYATPRALRALLDDPQLRIYDNPEQHVACVYDPARSLCRVEGAESIKTPSILSCGSACGNIVRTDGHVEDLEAEAHRHRAAADSALLPEPLRLRHLQRAGTIDRMVESHRRDRLTAVGAPPTGEGPEDA